MHQRILSSLRIISIWLPIALLTYLRLNHVPWRDEIQVWVLTEHSNLKELWQEHTVNGSLFLLMFYKSLILIGMSYIQFNFLVTLFVTFSILTFLNSKNLPLWYRFVLVFTPVYFYEYLVLNRTYCLYFSLMALSLSVSSKKQQSPKYFLFILLAISCLGFFGLITALFLTISLLLIPQIKKIKLSRSKKVIISLITGINLFPFITNFGEDIASSPNTKVVVRDVLLQFKTTLVNFSKTFFGLSDLKSPHILEREIPTSFPVVMAIVMSVTLLLLILMQTYFFSIGHAICGGIFSLGLFMFYVFVYPATNRHFVLVFLYTFWSFGFSLIRGHPIRAKTKPPKELFIRTSILVIGSTSILMQFVNASLTIRQELKIPFSSIHELRDDEISERVLFYPDFLGISFSFAKSNNNSIEYESYFPEGNYFGVYRDYGNSRNLQSTIDLEMFCNSEKRKVMVTYLEIAERIERLKLGKLVAISSVAIVEDESEITKINIGNTCQSKEKQDQFLQILRRAKEGNLDGKS